MPCPLPFHPRHQSTSVALLDPNSLTTEKHIGKKEEANNKQSAQRVKEAPASQPPQHLYSNPSAPFVTYSTAEYSVKVFYPKKFEVLRKFYCGSHLNFI